MTDEATPRPWEVYQLDPDNWGICELAMPPHGFFATKQDAELTVAAVNSYDKDREAKVKALVEAAEAAFDFISSEYRDPGQEPNGDWIAPCAAPIRDVLANAIAALIAMEEPPAISTQKENGDE